MSTIRILQKRFGLRVATGLTILLLLYVAPLVAGPNVWTHLGLGGAVYALVIDPQNSSVLYAGTNQGIYKSADAGKSWALSNNGLPVSTVSTYELGIAPGVPGAIYAAVFLNGVFKSTNGAATWSAASDGLTDLNVISLAVSPASPGTLYAGTRSGAFVSTDASGTWRAIGLADTGQVQALAADPSDALTVYAGTIPSGLYKSRNGGGTWSLTSLTDSVYAIAIDPTDSSRLYAATSGGIGSVSKSVDGGATWTRVFENPSHVSPVTEVAVDPSNPSRVYAGGDSVESVFRSTDGGQTWALFDSGLPNVQVGFAIDPSGTILYARTSGMLSGSGLGVWRYEYVTPCTGGAELCLLGNRFRATLSAYDSRTGRTGQGTAIPQGDRHGSFSLPSFTDDPTFPEVIVKMVDAGGLPPPLGDYFWVFHTGLTDLQYTLTITDSVTGAVKTYENNPSDPAKLCGGADTAAFPRELPP